MLVEIQITVSGIQRQNNQLVVEMATLRNPVKSQKRELDATKGALEKVKTQNREFQRELEDVREKAAEREMEIEELYDLQDALEQYTRKQSLEIHGIPESAYTSTEDAVLKVAQALDVLVTADDIDISHKLNSKGEKSILVKFTSHKAKTKLYKKRACLKHVKIADLYPEALATTRVEGKKISINENLFSFRRDLVKKPMRKEWTDCY